MAVLLTSLIGQLSIPVQVTENTRNCFLFLMSMNSLWLVTYDKKCLGHRFHCVILIINYHTTVSLVMCQTLKISYFEHLSLTNEQYSSDVTQYH